MKDLQSVSWKKNTGVKYPVS